MLNQILLIVLINLVVYFRTFKYGWVSDDILSSSFNKPDFKPPKNKFKYFWLHLRGTYLENTDIARAINIVVHTINCLLIWWVFGHNNVSFLASILFAINPINTQGGSIWVSGKSYSISTMLALLMFVMPILSPLWYYLCSFFSGNALLSPLYFMETPYPVYAFLPFIMGLFLRRVIATKMDVKAQTFNNEMSQIYPRKLILAVKTYGYYVRQCLYPVNLGLYHSFIWGVGVNKTYNKKCYALNKDFWAGILTIVASIVFMYFDKSSAKLGLFWFIINVFMWLNLITIQQQIAERYLYLPNVGMMFFLACLIINYPIVITVFIVFYLTRLWWYMPAYINDYWHMLYNVCEDKYAHYPWCELAMKYFSDNNFTAAYTMWCEAHHRSPFDFKPLFNISTMLIVMGRFDEARDFLENAANNMYEGTEVKWVNEFIEHNRMLIDKIKREKRLQMKDIKVIK